MSLPPLVSEVSLRSVGIRAAGNSYRTEVSRYRFFGDRVLLVLLREWSGYS